MEFQELVRSGGWGESGTRVVGSGGRGTHKTVSQAGARAEKETYSEGSTDGSRWGELAGRVVARSHGRVSPRSSGGPGTGTS